jgi:hypothetical protein
MTDLLIRDVPDDVLSAIDQRAKRLGLSRSEYLRRALAREATTPRGNLSVDDLRRFSQRFADLADPEIMRKAWE